GAYTLRKTYNSRLKKSIILTFSALLLILLSTVFANMLNKKTSKEDIEVIDTQMAEIKKEEPVALPPPPPPPPPPIPPPPPEVNQVKYVPPKVVKDELVKPEEKIEDIKEDQVISTKTVETENKVQIVQKPVEDKGSNIVTAPAIDYENTVFTKVEIEAAFPGGIAAWRRYLTNNLDANAPIDNGAPEGTYTVIVRFIVSKSGAISDVVAETKFGYGMEQEAVRAIKKGPQWKPGIQNGNQVTSVRRQPITFIVAGE
ncbi:MAG: energy transducer TonB, partial [Ferruginibacter sp.]